MTPEQVGGYIMLALIAVVVLIALWEMFRGVRWLVRKTRSWITVRRLERQYKRPARIRGQDGG